MNSKYFIYSVAISCSFLLFLTSCSGSVIHAPLSNTGNRATPLSFGMYVTPDPAYNPIDPPERFIGFHAAVDFEISEGELEGDVPVYAICSGKVVYSGYADGYGGLIIQRCNLNGENVTVLYGHLDLEGVPPEGAKVQPGQVIGLLAPARSYMSDNNRKHLYLGIHKGTTLDVRGYVQTEEELDGYIDPATIFNASFIDLPGQSPGETPYWQKEDQNEEDQDDEF